MFYYYLPSHPVYPLPMNPKGHAPHVLLPSVFSQVTYLSQPLVAQAHSSMSINIVNIKCCSQVQRDSTLANESISREPTITFTLEGFSDIVTCCICTAIGDFSTNI